MGTAVDMKNGGKSASDAGQGDDRSERVKRRHNPRTYNGNKREKEMYGHREECLRQSYPLPEENAVVSMWDVVFLERNRRVDKWGEVEEVGSTGGAHIVFVPMEGCTSENGEIKEFRVLSYTHGRHNPLHPHNKMVLECVYPYCSRGIAKMTVPTCWIATGSARVKVLKLYYNAKEYEEL